MDRFWVYYKGLNDGPIMGYESTKEVKADSKYFDLRKLKKNVIIYCDRKECDKIRFDLKTKTKARVLCCTC